MLAARHVVNGFDWWPWSLAVFPSGCRQAQPSRDPFEHNGDKEKVKAKNTVSACFCVLWLAAIL